jgi:hypothetical protein
LKRLAEGIATETNQTISEAQPLLSAQIASPQHVGLFFRIQFVRDPAVTGGSIGLSIRKPSILSLPFSAYEEVLNSVEPFAKSLQKIKSYSIYTKPETFMSSFVKRWVMKKISLFLRVLVQEKQLFLTPLFMTAYHWAND